MNQEILKSINWHITTKCNYKCDFCYVQKLDNEIVDRNEALSVLERLRNTKTDVIDIEKINFVGGEPFLHPFFYDLLKKAHEMGFTTSIVTNGSLINKRNIGEIAKYTDWIGLSVDSMSNKKEAELGRGKGNHVSNAIKVSDLVHEFGIKLKLNTSVTRLTYQENMHDLIHRMNPHRWKAFQVLHIKGQNYDCMEKLGITDEQFNDFIGRHEHIRLSGGVKPVFESNDDMKGSYLMLSPSGKIISNSDGSYKTFEFCDFVGNPKSVVDVSKYLGREGVYDWCK